MYAMKVTYAVAVWAVVRAQPHIAEPTPIVRTGPGDVTVVDSGSVPRMNRTLASVAISGQPGSISSRRHVMAKVPSVPSALVAASGLVGGYGVARWTRKRQLGGVVLTAAGATAAQQWRQRAGGKAAGALTVAYVAAFAGSHPLAKKVGAWPAVLGVAGAVALASWAVADRRA
jgi:hypothetical protein